MNQYQNMPTNPYITNRESISQIVDKGLKNDFSLSREVGLFLRMTIESLRRLVDKEGLETIRINNRGDHRFSKEAVINFLIKNNEKN